MDVTRMDVIIVEQAVLLVAVLWFGRRWGKWTASRDRLTESTNHLIGELRRHRPANTIDAANHVASFVYNDDQSKEAS